LIVTVTKQLPGGAAHSLKLRYQARKGTTHAYDSLSTWNATVGDADRCANLTAAVATAILCDDSSAVPDSFPITPDTTEVIDPFTSSSGVTDHHAAPENHLEMYGGDIVGMLDPTHDHPSCTSKCADDYATTTITFNVATVPTTVELLFGGHLAVSPLNRGGWGPTYGASNINGGPYHIKWDAADGGSVGNRDNQITGDAIQALAEPGLSTSASGTSATIGTAVTLGDTVTLGGATDPTGQTLFSLWGPYGSSDTPTCNTDTANPESAVLTATISGASSYTKTLPVGETTGLGTWTGTGTAASHTFLAGSAGTYYWTAVYTADANNVGAGPDACGETGERVIVSKDTAGGSTTIVLDDTVTVTASATGPTPTGSATFSLWDDADGSTCGSVVLPVPATPVWGPTTVLLGGGGAATASAAFATTTGTTYHWLVTYSGDGVYNPATISNCAETAAIT
jgi:hypothetical protein